MRNSADLAVYAPPLSNMSIAKRHVHWCLVEICALHMKSTPCTFSPTLDQNLQQSTACSASMNNFPRMRVKQAAAPPGQGNPSLAQISACNAWTESVILGYTA